MPHAYTEGQQAPRTLTRPGGTLSHPMGEGASLGRETKGEVVLVSRLRAALDRLNPALPPEAITASGLIEWLAAFRCKSLISKGFLFE